MSSGINNLLKQTEALHKHRASAIDQMMQTRSYEEAVPGFSAAHQTKIILRKVLQVWLQLDSPDLGLRGHMMFPDLSDDEFVRQAEIYVQQIGGLTQVEVSEDMGITDTGITRSGRLAVAWILGSNKLIALGTAENCV